MNELLVYNRPKSHVSEAIRTLRTNLEFTFVGNEKNVILITSSMPGEGKSFISANLAASFSMIDCILNMSCEEFYEFCNNRACDGNWSAVEALVCLDIVDKLNNVKVKGFFFKKKKLKKAREEEWQKIKSSLQVNS